MHPHIFELFTQVSGSAQSSHGGLGIGLSLVKNFVELHGGSVQVKSEGAGTGSEFIVRLPLAQARA
jgi:signal transduction histidine kinase